MLDTDQHRYLTAMKLDRPIDIVDRIGREPRRVMVACTHRLGDTLVTLPAVEALRRRFPRATLTMLVASASRDLIARLPYVDVVQDLPTDDWGIHDLAQREDFLVTFRRWTVAPSGSGADRVGPAVLEVNTDILVGSPKLVHLHYLDALRLVGIASQAHAPSVKLLAADRAKARAFLRRAGLQGRSPRVALHSGSYYAGKRWYPDRYATVVEWLHRCHGASFVVVEGRGEEELTRKVTARVPTSCVARASGLQLPELAAVIGACDFYLGNDTGILHLADAVGCPSVAVFGPSRPLVWGSADPRSVYVVADEVWRGCASCSGRFGTDKPCARPDSQPCLGSVRPEDVMAAVESVIALLGLRARLPQLDSIAVTDNFHRKKIGRDGLLLTNMGLMRPLFVLKGGTVVDRLLEAVRRTGSYRTAQKEVPQGAALLDGLMAYRIVLPANDGEPQLDQADHEARIETLSHPVVDEMGRFGQPDAIGPRRDTAMPGARAQRPLRILLSNAIEPSTYGGGERWMVRVGVELKRRGHEVLCWGLAGHPWLMEADRAGMVRLAGSVPETVPLADAAGLARRFARLALDAAILAQDRDVVGLALPLRMAGVAVVLARKGLPMGDDPPMVRWAHGAAVHGVITPSEKTRDEILELGWLHPSRARVIVNGVDARAQRRASAGTDILRTDLGLDRTSPVLLNVGRLSAHKGQLTLLQAMPRVLAKHPGTRLLLAGRGPRHGVLGRAIQVLGIAAEVHLLGERWDAPRLLALADCFVLPSHYEGLSTALLEAMAAGVPVVATGVSGTGEVVRDGITGLLVPPDDPVALAAAIHEVLADRRKARRMAMAARQLVEREFSFTRMVDEVESLLIRGLQ